MPIFEDLYAAFQLEPSQREALQKLADLSSLGTVQSTRLMVETAIIDGGEKTVVSKEETHAQLVRAPQGVGASRQYL